MVSHPETGSDSPIGSDRDRVRDNSSMSLFLVGIGMISFGSPKLKLRHFNAKLVSMPSSLGYLLLFPISGVLNP